MALPPVKILPDLIVDGRIVKQDVNGNEIIVQSSSSFSSSVPITSSYFVGSGRYLTEISASSATTASYALTAAYAQNAGSGLSSVYTSGSITGSGLIENPVILKDPLLIGQITASQGFSGNLYGTASYANTASYAENFSNFSNQYNSLREIITGSFNIDGTKTVELQKFSNTDIDYITLDITTKPSGQSYYTNDLLSFHISGNLNNKLSLYISAPAYSSGDRYKIIAVKEVGNF